MVRILFPQFWRFVECFFHQIGSFGKAARLPRLECFLSHVFCNTIICR